MTPIRNFPLSTDRTSGLIVYREGLSGLIVFKIVMLAASVFYGVWLSVLAESAFAKNERPTNKGIYAGSVALVWSVVALIIRSVINDRRAMNHSAEHLLPAEDVRP